MSLQIECLAPLIPQNGHNASTSTSSLSSFLSPGVFLTFSHVSRWMFIPHLSSCFKVAVLHQRTANKVRFLFFLPQCLSVPRAAFHFYAPQCLLISISVWMSLHLQPPRLSFLRCILFIIFLNWFHSVQAYAFSTLIALLDSCKEILLRHINI